MSNQKAFQAAQANQAAWKQLALDLNQPLPHAGARVATNSLPREPTLTQKFNAAAKKPVMYDAAQGPISKRQIDVLRRQMSQPRATFEMTPLGSVLKARNPEKDRRLEKAVIAITNRLEQQKGLKQHFNLTANKGRAQQQFNQVFKGLGK